MLHPALLSRAHTCTASDRVIGLSAYQSVSLPVDTKVSIFERIRNTCSWKTSLS